MTEPTQGQLLGTARPGANASVMWKLATRSLYASGDLPVLAVREGLQNAADSIRQAYREGKLKKGEGRFHVQLYTSDGSLARNYDVKQGDANVLQLTDNGVGMSLETFTSRFMVLGETTKRDATSATGGFGIAKAVILGASSTFRWTLQTRDFTAISDGEGSEIRLVSSSYFQGVILRLLDWDPRYWRYYVQASQEMQVLPQRLVDNLRGNDLDDINLFYNDQPIEPLFSRRRGTALNVFGTDWGGSQVRIKKYTTQDSPQFWVRANGLLQFRNAAPAVLRIHVVVDVTPSVPPGHQNYPFNAARDGFLGESARVFDSLVENLRHEALSASREEEDETWAQESETDPALMSQKARLLSRITDPELLRLLKGESALPGPTDPAATPSGAGQTSGNSGDDLPETGQAAAPPQDSEHTSAGSSGKRIAAPIVDVMGQKTTSHRRGNPLGSLGSLRIAKGFSKDKVRAFKRNIKRYVPILLLWEVTLKLLAAMARIRGYFNVGLVLEENVNGMAEKEPNRAATLYLNPIAFEDAIQLFGRDPLRTTGWIYGVALHELAHFNGNMGNGHDQLFVSEREALQRRTFQLVPRLVQTTISVLDLEPQANPMAEKIRGLEQELKRCARQRQRDEERRAELSKLRTALRRCQDQMQRKLVDTIDEAENQCQNGECPLPSTDSPTESVTASDDIPLNAETLLQRIYEQIWSETPPSERPLITLLFQRLYHSLLIRIQEHLREKEPS